MPWFAARAPKRRRRFRGWIFFCSSRRRHTRSLRDWSSDVCSSDLVGAVPHQFDAWGVDFAFWCSYKYLNAGPGATGGLYLNRNHFGGAPGLAGWFSSRKDRQMDMTPALEPAWGAGALQIGTPNILSMAPLQGALKLLAEAGLERLRAKSLRLTA